MPFKKLEVSAVIKEKRKDEEFNMHYKAVGLEYAFIKEIVDARKDKGYSQKVLASIAGVSQQDISRFERAEHFLTLRKLLKITSALGVKIKIEK